MLSQLTTSAVGGPAGTFIEARTEEEIIDAVRSADAAGDRLLLISGGSNLLVSDDGFPGTVVRIASEGFTVNAEDSCGGVAVVVQAGHNWDRLVEYASPVATEMIRTFKVVCTMISSAVEDAYG